MVELLLFVLAVALLYRSLRQLSPRQGLTTASPASSPAPVASNNLQSAAASLPVRPPQPNIISALDYAQRLYAERRYLAAEKAFLAVLKSDHKNIVAYHRLGMIYRTLKNFPESIECFQVVCQLEPTAANFYSLGLVYYENKNYLKAIATFESANDATPTASAYLGLARTYQKLANSFKAQLALEKAAELDPTTRHLQLLAEAYLAGRNKEQAKKTYERILEVDPGNERAKRALMPLAEKLEKKGL